MNDWFQQLIAASPAMNWAVVGAIITAVVCGVLTRPALIACDTSVRRWPVLVTLVGLFVGAALAFSMHELQCQKTPEVIPSQRWLDLRIVYHSICLGLLLVITATDLATLYIPNFVVRLGLVLAIAGAAFSGEFQMVHLWVDWNDEIPQIRGPMIPDWIEQHEHWHGLGWSTVGALAGAGLTALVRKISAFALGRPAMGAGDVTLMAMIGAFLGWQPTVIAFFIAPPLALLLGPLARRISREVAIPYGPFLALGAIIVMFSWRWIWMFEIDISTTGPQAIDDRATAFAVRRMFGDGMLLAGLSVVAFGGTAGLMSLMRLFWTLPIQREAVEPHRLTPHPAAGHSASINGSACAPFGPGAVDSRPNPPNLQADEGPAPPCA